MHEVLVNRLGGLSLARKSVVRLTDRPNMNLDVYRGPKTTMQQQQQQQIYGSWYRYLLQQLECINGKLKINLFSIVRLEKLKVCKNILPALGAGMGWGGGGDLKVSLTFNRRKFEGKPLRFYKCRY